MVTSCGGMVGILLFSFLEAGTQTVLLETHVTDVPSVTIL